MSEEDAARSGAVVIGLCLGYTTQAQNDENNVTVKIEQQAVEEHTVTSPVADVVVNEYGSQAPGPVQDTDPIIDRSSHYHHADPKFHGFWKKKVAWRPRWVKTWKEKKIYVAVWKKMWGPVMVNEWVPIPKPPPGWVHHGIGHGHQDYYVKPYPHF